MADFDRYNQEIKNFTSRGNRVIGRPTTIIGDFSIPEFVNGTSIEFGENVTLCNTTLHFPLGGGVLRIADDVLFRSWTHVGPESYISIGKGTYFNRDCELHAWEGAYIEVGKGCLFSNVKVRTSDMHSIYQMSDGKKINHARSVSIGDKVWLAESVVVRKGARVGNGSVVGSGSLVSGYIPENCVAVGQPARVVKRGIYWGAELDMSSPESLPPTEIAYDK